MQAVDILLEEVSAKPCVDKPHHGAVPAEKAQHFLYAFTPLDASKANNHGELAERAKQCPMGETADEKDQNKQQHPCGLRLRQQACQPLRALAVGVLAVYGSRHEGEQAAEIECNMIYGVMVGEERPIVPANQKGTDDVEPVRASQNFTPRPGRAAQTLGGLSTPAECRGT